MNPIWPRGSAQNAPARLVALDENEQPITGGAIPLSRQEITFGTDPQRATQVLERAHVARDELDPHALPPVLRQAPRQEAQAMELPVIVSDIGGVSEGLIDGVSGFLIKPKDIESITSKILFLINHPEELPKMGSAGKKFVKNKYDKPIISKKIINLYTALISDGHS